jgi:hypothetical protein
MTGTQLKCLVWTVSGEKKKAVSEVMRKYDVCVCVCVKYNDFSDTTPGHNLTNLEDEISCLYTYIGPKQKRK